MYQSKIEKVKTKCLTMLREQQSSLNSKYQMKFDMFKEQIHQVKKKYSLKLGTI